MMVHMDAYRRTQVYLPPYDHGELRRVAGRRGVSMAALVREAVSHYLVNAERGPGRPWWDEPDYASLGIPEGSAGLAARMRARSGTPSPQEPSDLSPHDREIGEFLYREYLQHRADYAERRRHGEDDW
jgi:hypothetical protein